MAALLLQALLTSAAAAQQAQPPSAAPAEPAAPMNVLYLSDDQVQPGLLDLMLHFQTTLRGRWPGKVMIGIESSDFHKAA